MQSKFDSLGRRNIQLSGITDAVSGWDGETDRGYVNVNDCANRRRSISIYSRIPGYVAQDRYAVWPLREIHYSTVLRRHCYVRLGRCNSLASRFHIGETWARKRVNVRNSISDDITAIALRHAWRAAKCTSALTLFLPFPFFFFDHERTRRILMVKSFFRHYRKRGLIVSGRKWEWAPRGFRLSPRVTRFCSCRPYHANCRIWASQSKWECMSALVPF